MRQRLPNRRECVTEEIEVARPGAMPASYLATIGFEGAAPREIFLTGAKAGTEMAAILSDAAVALSVALQCGVPVTALAHSVARTEEADGGPASVIGAALDLLARYEQ